MGCCEAYQLYIGHSHQLPALWENESYVHAHISTRFRTSLCVLTKAAVPNAPLSILGLPERFARNTPAQHSATALLRMGRGDLLPGWRCDGVAANLVWSYY